jgi:hypothetical protein
MRRGRALIRKPAIPRARGWCWWGGVVVFCISSIGEEQFRQIIRTFLSEFKDKPADFKDFQQVAERVSRRDLGKYFNEWIYGAESSQLLLDKVPITEIIKRY